VRDFTEPEVVDALRTLLEKGWIDAYGFGRDRDGHEVLAKVEVAQTSEKAIRSYWFEPTQVGRDVWWDWEPPPEPAE